MSRAYPTRSRTAPFAIPSVRADSNYLNGSSSDNSSLLRMQRSDEFEAIERGTGVYREFARAAVETFKIIPRAINDTLSLSLSRINRIRIIYMRIVSFRSIAFRSNDRNVNNGIAPIFDSILPSSSMEGRLISSRLHANLADREVYTFPAAVRCTRSRGTRGGRYSRGWSHRRAYLVTIISPRRTRSTVKQMRGPHTRGKRG